MRDTEYFLDGVIEFLRLLAFVAMAIVAMITFPIWGIPYVIWKRRKENK